MVLAPASPGSTGLTLMHTCAGVSQTQGKALSVNIRCWQTITREVRGQCESRKHTWMASPPPPPAVLLGAGLQLADASSCADAGDALRRSRRRLAGRSITSVACDHQTDLHNARSTRAAESHTRTAAALNTPGQPLADRQLGSRGKQHKMQRAQIARAPQTTLAWGRRQGDGSDPPVMSHSNPAAMQVDTEAGSEEEQEDRCRTRTPCLHDGLR